MINKGIRDLIEKYTFITRTEFVNGRVRLYYLKDGVEKFKTIAYRAGKKLLISKIDEIKDEIDWHNTRLTHFKKANEMIKEQPFYVEVVK
jgi:hypothetical protein